MVGAGMRQEILSAVPSAVAEDMMAGYPVGIMVVAARDILIGGKLVAHQGDDAVVQGRWGQQGDSRILVKFTERRDGKMSPVTVLACQVIPNGRSPAQLMSEAHPEDQPHEVEYRVTIQRLGNLPIGICWDGQEFIVNDSERSMMKAWNAQNPGTIILSGDSIVEVNRVRDNCALMLMEILNEPVLELFLRKEADLVDAPEGGDGTYTWGELHPVPPRRRPL